MSDRPADRDLLERLAEAIADGEAVDWQELEAAGLNRDDRMAVGLRRIATFSGVLSAADDEVDGESTREWGHLKIGAELGRGSFGEVYRAYDPVLRRTVALKLRARRLPEHADEVAAVDSFLSEARRLARVRHPNVLAVHGADVHEGRAGLWADLLQGETLERLIEREAPLPAERCQQIASDIASALEAVHAAGIVHGDVKASNIMLESNGRAVLMDFGAGLDLTRDSNANPAIGSPLSMAPEQFTGDAASFASDLYSVGVLLYRMSTGQYPVIADDMRQLVQRHQHPGSRPEWSRGRSTPSPLRRLVGRLLDHQPAARGTATELVAALNRIEQAPRLRRRRLALGAVVASLSVAVVASTVGLLISRQATEEAEQQRRLAENTTEFLTDLLLSPNPQHDGPDVRVLDVMERAEQLADLESDFLLRGRLRTLIGRVRGSLGQVDEAMTMLDRAREDFESSTTGAAMLEQADVDLYRATLMMERGDVEESERILDRLAAFARALPPEAETRLHWTRMQGVLFARRGDFEQAESLLSEVRAQARPGVESEQIRMAANPLAVTLEQTGRPEEAEDLYRAAIQETIERYGERHEDALSLRNNLAGLLAAQGRLDEAEQIYRRLMRTAGQWLGNTHTYSLLAMTALANVTSEAGRLEEAMVLDDQAFPLVLEGWGEEHTRTQVVRMNMANRRLISGRIDEAEALLTVAVDRLEATLGPKAPPLIYARMLRGQLYLETGRAREARDYAVETLRRARDGVGERSSLTLSTQSRLAQAQLALGQVATSRALLSKTLAVQREAVSPEAPETLRTQVALGDAILAAGDRDLALELYCQALETLTVALGAEHRQTVETSQKVQPLGECAGHSG